MRLDLPVDFDNRDRLLLPAGAASRLQLAMQRESCRSESNRKHRAPEAFFDKVLSRPGGKCHRFFRTATFETVCPQGKAWCDLPPEHWLHSGVFDGGSV